MIISRGNDGDHCIIFKSLNLFVKKWFWNDSKPFFEISKNHFFSRKIGVSCSSNKRFLRLIQILAKVSKSLGTPELIIDYVGQNWISRLERIKYATFILVVFPYHNIFVRSCTVGVGPSCNSYYLAKLFAGLCPSF